jgi:hypothetical protein
MRFPSPSRLIRFSFDVIDIFMHSKSVFSTEYECGCGRSASRFSLFSSGCVGGDPITAWNEVHKVWTTTTRHAGIFRFRGGKCKSLCCSWLVLVLLAGNFAFFLSTFHLFSEACKRWGLAGIEMEAWTSSARGLLHLQIAHRSIAGNGVFRLLLLGP